MTVDNVSAQADGTNTIFTVNRKPIADRNGDGLVNSSDVNVDVDGSAYVVVAMNVGTGEITLSNAPPAGATVLITYSY
ncbi:MAG: hypothetical protein V3U26_06005 [Dehalococcoidia bacterium]